MLKRTVTGAAITLAAIPVCIFSHTIVFSVVASILALFGTWEMLSCVGCAKKHSIAWPLLAFSLAMPVSAFAVNDRDSFLTIFVAILTILMVYLFALPVFFTEKIDVTDVCTSFMTGVYVTTAFTSAVLLRYSENGIYYYLMPLAAPMVCDIFAYITGRMFGKHKLIPKVSPKKTVEGAIGGTVFCIGACTGYGAIIRSVTEEAMLPLWAFAAGGLVIAVVSQVGDLIASAVKRKYGVKDYGKIFPGHGGVIDRFDSMMATCTLFFIFTEVLQTIGV